MGDSFEITEDYQSFLSDLRERIRSAQVRAALSVNAELVTLYWQIGRAILERQRQHGWGAKVVERLSADLRRAFPQMKGFSPRNLKYMRAFAEAYPDEQSVQQVVAQIPWGHNVRILDAAGGPEEREWYARRLCCKHCFEAHESFTSFAATRRPRRAPRRTSPDLSCLFRR